MDPIARPVGRPGRYAKYEAFEAALPANMTKRPRYCEGIGLFKGAASFTVWVKIRLPRGGNYKGRTIAPGGPIEHKLGNRASWDWRQLLAERDRLQGLADRGEPIEATEVPLFSAYAKQWLERKKPILRGFGVTKGHIDASLVPTFGRKALNAITRDDVNRWIGKERERLKPSTVQRKMATFSAIMNDAVRNGLVERNPASQADRIRGIEPRQRFITDEEWKQILAAADEIEAEHEREKERVPHRIRGWLRHYVAWALHSGMRRAEIHGLTFDHIRTVDDAVVVVEVVNTKTGKPRFVTCTDEMLAIIRALKQLDRAPEDNRLFPVSMTTLKRALTRLWKRTGLKDVRLHDLRRTHASKLLRMNIDARTVAGRLGHSGTGMLARHYAVDLGDVEAARAFA